MGKRLIGSVGLAPGTDEGTDLTTKGDIHGYSTSNTRIPIGDNDQVLTADSSEALGLKWATAGGGATTGQSSATITSDFTTTSTSFAIVTSVVVTVLDSSGGVAIVQATISFNRSNAGGIAFALYNDGSRIADNWLAFETAGDSAYSMTQGTTLDSDGSVIQLYGKTGSGTLTVQGDSSNRTTAIHTIGVA